MRFSSLVCQLLLLICALCGTGLVSAQDPSTTPSSRTFRSVCYIEGWARYHRPPVRFVPENVDTSLCTHLVFAFASLDATGLRIVPADSYQDTQMYHRLVGLKRQNPSLKVMLSLGGWNMGSLGFSKMVSSPGNMQIFAGNAVSFLHQYNFDGLDINWEYPADRGSPAADKYHFTQMLQVVQSEFSRDHTLTSRPRLILSIAISPVPYRVAISYELPDIANNVDFVNLMTYNIHGSWDGIVAHHSALYSPTGHDQSDSIDFMINFVLNTTVPREKINLGMAFYSNSLVLADPTNSQVGAPITGDAPGGEYVGTVGHMYYFEICKLLTDHNDTITDSGRLPGTKAPYVVDGSRWTGYDDAESLREKVDYIIVNGLGGVFIWSLDMDDFNNVCGQGNYPLMNAIQDEFQQNIGR